MLKILLVCTGNSVRSILAEAIFNRDGAGRVQAFSAGTNPAGRVHLGVLDLLARRGVRLSGLRSKSWHEFAAPHGTPMDAVIWLCTTAAAEKPPAWPGDPLLVVWPIADPLGGPTEQLDLALQVTYSRLSARINALLATPLEQLSRAGLAEVLG